MAYTKHPMQALMQLDPKQAKAKLLEAYRAAGASKRGVAVALGCTEQTIQNWLKTLDLETAFARLKKRAIKEGWHHDHSRQGGRPKGSKNLHE